MSELSAVELGPARPGDLDGVAVVWHESARKMDGAPDRMPTRFALRRRIDREIAAGWAL